MDRGAWWATVYEVARVGHDLVTKPPATTTIRHIKSQSDSPIYYLCDHKHYLMSLLFSVFMCKKENNKNTHINIDVRIKYV